MTTKEAEEKLQLPLTTRPRHETGLVIRRWPNKSFLPVAWHCDGGFAWLALIVGMTDK
jgi:hypothetical protein